MFFRMLYDDKLAQAAYLVGCQGTGEAVIIDPERDVDRYLEAAAQEGLTITAITETHIHADFLSGARELAERTGARLYLSDEGDADWKYLWLDKKQGGGSYDHQLVKDGDAFRIGKVEIKVVHTPGHTPEHISFLVTDHGSGVSEPMGIASGDFVFVGAVGRPDLLETAAGIQGAKEESARVLFQSIQRFKELPDYLQLWPGHGSGSACGKALGAVPQSTVGYEKRFNTSIQDAGNEAQFVRSVLYGQGEPPLYFARMKKENKEGPAILGKMPEPAELRVEDIKKMLRADKVLLDTRTWPEFVEGHLPGSLFTPLDKSFPTITGSYVEPGQPVYLVVEAGRVQEAVTDLIRIGLDEVVGFVTPETVSRYTAQGNEIQKMRHCNMTDFLDLSKCDGGQILDVRQPEEYEAGRLPNAINVAHTKLLHRQNEIAKDRTVLVHCHSGLRSAYAAALLQSSGYDVIHLDGGFVTWRAANGEIVQK
ncbi:MAG: MBL fold metallo-hydrolase [Caldithrix sp.]|nr:MAG: MBL fold metallo-hydrolase [Caldithrix sp.]